MRAHILPMGPKPKPKAERFAKLFEKRGDDECWPWIGLVNYQNRGRFYWDSVKKMVNAGRAAMWLAGKDLPDDRMACHTCDNANCVNLKHLYAGTAHQNVADGWERNRFERFKPNRPKGEKHAMRKVSEKQVLEILSKYKNGESRKAIAAEYRITCQTVWRIGTGKNWTHLTPPCLPAG